jgi:hypothetical protein
VRERAREREREREERERRERGERGGREERETGGSYETVHCTCMYSLTYKRWLCHTYHPTYTYIPHTRVL